MPAPFSWGLPTTEATNSGKRNKFVVRSSRSEVVFQGPRTATLVPLFCCHYCRSSICSIVSRSRPRADMLGSRLAITILRSSGIFFVRHLARRMEYPSFKSTSTIPLSLSFYSTSFLTSSDPLENASFMAGILSANSLQMGMLFLDFLVSQDKDFI